MNDTLKKFVVLGLGALLLAGCGAKTPTGTVEDATKTKEAAAEMESTDLDATLEELDNLDFGDSELNTF